MNTNIITRSYKTIPVKVTMAKNNSKGVKIRFINKKRITIIFTGEIPWVFKYLRASPNTIWLTEFNNFSSASQVNSNTNWTITDN